MALASRRDIEGSFDRIPSSSGDAYFGKGNLAQPTYNGNTPSALLALNQVPLLRGRPLQVYKASVSIFPHYLLRLT